MTSPPPESSVPLEINAWMSEQVRELIESRWKEEWIVTCPNAYLTDSSGLIVLPYGETRRPFEYVAHAQVIRRMRRCGGGQMVYSARLSSLVHDDVRVCGRCLHGAFQDASGDPPAWEAWAWENYRRGLTPWEGLHLP